MSVELPDLLLIRGLPGSGKSTMAEYLATREEEPVFIYEADKFFTEPFETEGEYKYKHSKDLIPVAHEFCLSNAFYMLYHNMGKVIVSNTFTKLWEMDKYLAIANTLGLSVGILTLTQDFGSIHDIPQHTMNNMSNRFKSESDIMYALQRRTYDIDVSIYRTHNNSDDGFTLEKVEIVKPIVERGYIYDPMDTFDPDDYGADDA